MLFNLSRMVSSNIMIDSKLHNQIEEINQVTKNIESFLSTANSSRSSSYKVSDDLYKVFQDIQSSASAFSQA